MPVLAAEIAAKNLVLARFVEENGAFLANIDFKAEPGRVFQCHILWHGASLISIDRKP